MSAVVTTARHPGSLLTVLDLGQSPVLAVVELAAELKRAKAGGDERQWLTGRNVTLVSQKSSTHTWPLRSGIVDSAGQQRPAAVRCAGPKRASNGAV